MADVGRFSFRHCWLRWPPRGSAASRPRCPRRSPGRPVAPDYLVSRGENGVRDPGARREGAQGAGPGGQAYSRRACLCDRPCPARTAMPVLCGPRSTGARTTCYAHLRSGSQWFPSPHL